MKIKVKYFAMLRESAGKKEELIDLENSNIRDLFNQLNQKYRFSIDDHHLAVAINGHYRNWDYLMSDGDEVVFIPPVAGG